MKVKKSFLMMISCLLGVVTAALITLVGMGSKFNGLWKFEAYGLLLTPVIDQRLLHQNPLFGLF